MKDLVWRGDLSPFQRAALAECGQHYRNTLPMPVDHSPCRSELAREKPESAVGCQAASVIFTTIASELAPTGDLRRSQSILGAASLPDGDKSPRHRTPRRRQKSGLQSRCCQRFFLLKQPEIRVIVDYPLNVF